MIMVALNVIYALNTGGQVADKRADKDGGEAHLEIACFPFAMETNLGSYIDL